MVVPFGVSVGDFVSAGDLVYRIVKALNSSRGSCSDYKDLLCALSSLDQCLRTTSAVVLSLSFENGDRPYDNNVASIANGIKHELDCCKQLLEEFLLSSWKYAESLLNGRPGKRFKDEWNKVRWFLYKKEDIDRLLRDLKSHIQAFQLYALAFCCQTSSAQHKLLDDSIASSQIVSVRLEKMSQLLQSLTESIPDVLRYNWAGGMSSSDMPIRFSDALGREMFIPLIFCSSVQTFHDILLVLFKNTPGRNKVHRKEYELQDEFGDSLVEAQTWQRKALPGAVITMSVLLQLSSKSSESSRSCPRCRTVNHQPTSSRMIQCCFCQVWFEILEEEKARIVEMVEELTLIEEDITPKVSQENGRTTNKKKTAPRKVQPKKPIKEQDVFKRISYVRQNQKRPPQSTRRVSDSEMTAYNSAEADASPIFTYAKFGDAKTVRKLLDDGADVNQEHTSDGSVLQQAARSGSLVLVQLVLDYGGDILACGGHWGTALQAASAKAAHPATISMVKLLLENGAEVEAQGGHYGNALQAAAAFYGLTNNSTVVELLLDAGAKVNAMGGEYGSALSVASYKGAEKLVRLLVERGADVDAPSPWGSALQAAVSTEYGGGDEVARLLVEYGADVNIQGGDCGSALHCAAMKNKEWAVRLLVDNGAEVNVAVQGKTALDIAAELGLENIVTILLEGGAAPLQ